MLGIPREHERLFLFFARNGQAVADTMSLEEINDKINELKAYFRCNMINKNYIQEYFLQGYVPEIRKQYEKLHPLEEWNDILQEQCVKAGKSQFEVYYKQEIELRLK